MAKIMTKGIKNLIGCFLVLAMSLSTLYLISSSNQMKTGEEIAITMGAVAFAVISTSIFGLVGAVFCAGFAGIAASQVPAAGVAAIAICIAIAAICIAIAFFDAVAGYFSNKETKDNFKILVITATFFVVPILAGTIPLSKYYNQNQLVRDREIFKKLEIIQKDNEWEIIFPAEQADQQSYLCDVLTVKIQGKSYSWKDISIECWKGKKVWYKMKVESPEIEFYFNHTWEDLTLKKKVEYAKS